MIIKNKIIYGFIAAISLAVSACSDSAELDKADDPNSGISDRNVTISVSLPQLSMDTRDEASFRISDGKKIDKLYYEIYEVPYKEGKTEDFENAKLLEFAPGKSREVFDVNPKTWPIENIRLSLDLTQQKVCYRIVFWAQNSECDAYDITDLTNIKVKYSKDTNTINDNNTNNNTLYPNNDESRDAFCAVAVVEPTANLPVKKNVTLHRPFAQINIGTTGADYAGLIYYEYNIPTGITVTQSSVKIKGVANRLNLLTGKAMAVKVNGDNEELITDGSLEAKFDWANLPAWNNLKGEGLGLPKNRQLKKNENGILIDNRDEDPFVELPASQGTEEFLKVSLPNAEPGYRKIYPTVIYDITTDDDGKEIKEPSYLTDTFKYLSMCYVLVPSNDEKNSNTVTLSFNLQEYMGGAQETPRELTERTLYNVPAQANYRTNILAGLNNEEPDPTSIFNFYQLPMILQEEIGTYSNSRYYTAGINVTRTDKDNDRLSISSSNNDTFTLIDNDESQIIELSKTVFFTGAEAKYYFKVDNKYVVIISSNIEKPEDYKVDYSVAEKDEEGNDTGYEITTLTIYPAATAGQFYITVTPDPKKQDEDPTP